MLFGNKKKWNADTTTWMNLENMLCETSQSQKAVYCLIPLITCPNRQIHRNKVTSGCQGLGKRQLELHCWGYGVSFRGIRMFRNQTMVKIIGIYRYTEMIKSEFYSMWNISVSVNLLFKKPFLGMVLSFKYIALLSVSKHLLHIDLLLLL